MERSEIIYYYIFASLTIFICSDFNGFLSGLVGVEAAFSGIMLLLTLVLFLKSMSLRSRLVYLSKYLVFFYVFWLLYGLFLFYILGSSYGNPLERFRYYFPSILLILTYSKWFQLYFDKGMFTKIVNLISYSLLLNCLAIIYSSFVGGFTVRSEVLEDRSSGLIASVNQAGTTACIAQIFLLYKVVQFNQSAKIRLIHLCFYFIAVYAAILTFSKTALLNTVLTFFVSFAILLLGRNSIVKNIAWKSTRRWMLSVLTVVFVFAIVYGGVFLAGLERGQSERFEEFFLFLQGNINEETTTGRSNIAEFAFGRIADDMFMGRGLDTFHRIEGVGLGPHNVFLLILGEIGLFGLSLFLFYLFSMSKRIISIQSLPIRMLTVGILIILIITGMASHTLLYIKTYVLLFAFLNVIVYIPIKEKTAKLLT